MIYNDTLDAILLILQALLWGCAIYIIWKKNRLFGLFSMVLYLYLLPTEVTYRFYHHFANDYWGRDVWYESYWFISLSLLTLFLFFNIFDNSNRVYYVVYKNKHNAKWIGYVLITLFSIIASFYLFTNAPYITYHSLVENGSDGFALNAITVTDVLMKDLPAFVIIPLLATKNKSTLSMLLVIYNTLIYFAYAFLTGNRSDMLAFLLALVLLWLYERKLGPKQIIILGLFAVTFIYVAGMMSSLRGMEEGGSLAETLLKQDYMAPAYNIIGVQAKQVVDPYAVISSQLLKLFPTMGGEWLYIMIAPKIFGTEFTASQSAGFHPFTEGYLFAGFFGFLYNGIIIGLLLLFWNRLMHTNDKMFNRFLFALMGCLFFSLIRAQSVNFIRYLFFDFLPASFIYAQLNDIRIHYFGFLRIGKKQKR